MSNKNNSMRQDKFDALNHYDDDFRQRAEELEATRNVGYTSGMGQDNYHFCGAAAYSTYEGMVNTENPKK